MANDQFSIKIYSKDKVSRSELQHEKNIESFQME